MDNSKRLKVLIIGAQPPPIGGATLLVQDLINQLRKRTDVEVFVIDLSRTKNMLLHKLWIMLVALWKTLWLGLQVDVITLHANQYGRLFFGPLVFLLSRLLHKPLIVRAFGGTFDQQFQSLPRFYKWIMRHTYLDAEICLLETKRMIEYFSALPIRRAEWFSNYTQDVGLTEQTPFKTNCSTFVFVGRITPPKGIDEILAAAPLLDPGITLVLYGPLDKPYTAEQLNVNGHGRVKYRGILNRSEVAEKLWECDALVLPTYWFGEGYPATILEAYAHGLPVIATRWQSIPEIVDDKCGILVEPRNTEEFAEAVNRLYREPELYRQLQQGAREKFKLFSAAIWIEQFVTLCYEVAHSSSPPTQT